MIKAQPLLNSVVFIVIASVFVGCNSNKRTSENYYHLATRPATVETVEVMVQDFHGRPDVFADVRGRLSSNVAVLRDIEQYRENDIIHLKLSESTPLGAIGSRENPPYSTRTPLDVLGLVPGQTYKIVANSVVTEFTMP